MIDRNVCCVSCFISTIRRRINSLRHFSYHAQLSRKQNAKDLKAHKRKRYGGMEVEDGIQMGEGFSFRSLVTNASLYLVMIS